MPKFSIIIPTYNCSEFIREAVESVLVQSFRDFEIIVVDDGSSDSTGEVVEPYCSGGAFRYIRQENSGPGAARNNGIRNATGDYIILLDSDDLLYDGCLESLAAFLERNRGVDFLFTNYDIFDEHGVVAPSGVDTWKVFRSIPHQMVGEAEWVFSDSLARYIIEYGGFMHTSGTTIRRALFDDCGYFKEGYCYGEDDELYARASYRSLSGYIDRVLSGKRNHSASLIHNPDKKLRNARHYLELTEGQADYYRADRELSAVIRRKIAGLTYDYCWCLQANGLLEDARETIGRGLGKDFTWPLLKLLLKNYLLKVKMVRPHA